MNVGELLAWPRVPRNAAVRGYVPISLQFQANRALGHASGNRSYRVAGQVLAAIAVEESDLRTNAPEKVRQLQDCGIRIREVVATRLHLTRENARYLGAKVADGHTLQRLGSAIT